MHKYMFGMYMYIKLNHLIKKEVNINKRSEIIKCSSIIQCYYEIYNIVKLIIIISLTIFCVYMYLIYSSKILMAALNNKTV